MSQEEVDREKERLETGAREAFKAKDYAKAEALLRELVPLDHANFVPWYNLACALSLQSKVDESLKMLEQAIARGFANFGQMQRDPDLAALRDTPGYQRIAKSWTQIVNRQSESRVARLKARYLPEGEKGPYTFEQDDEHRLAIVSAFEPNLLKQAKDELGQLSRWWADSVLPKKVGGAAAAAAHAETPLVTVLLPTRADYRQWAFARFGEGWERIGGAYVHDERALVSMDLGATLRHEYWHVLHWRDMESRGQLHPIWIMEGLCSLPEDVEAGPKGEMIAKASWRTNIVRRLARASNLTPWDVLFAMDQKKFVGIRPLSFYAQGRGIFMWLHQRGRLRDWYDEYTRSFSEDSTGRVAFQRVFAKPLKDIERDFRLWARELPEVQEEVGRGPANLPVSVEPGQGDGVVVSPVAISSMLEEGSRDAKPSTRPDLRPGDVISAIDAKPVRDFNDLARVLGECQPGTTVTLDVRRRGKPINVRVTLVPPRE